MFIPRRRFRIPTFRRRSAPLALLLAVLAVAILRLDREPQAILNPSLAEDAGTFSAKVVGVTDGDTIRVLRDGMEVRVRLEGIDCPESKQPFGSRAKQFVSEHAFGMEVSVKAKGTDRYGRLLAEIILPDGSSLNQWLVREGLAWWYRRYSKDPTLGQLEEEARQAKRGIWSEPDPVPPWEFRSSRSKK